MQRRLELAKGLLHHPSVLLLDEPTTGLDPGARIDLWQYLRILRDEEKVTVIVTTHLMEEAERCDRLAFLNQGKLVALGTPLELKQEIGGDVVVLEAKDAESLADHIRIRFNTEAQVVQNQVRLEKQNGHRFITDVVEAFPGEIEAVSVSKPSLEDVFIRRTGHRFWTDRGARSDNGLTNTWKGTTSVIPKGFIRQPARLNAAAFEPGRAQQLRNKNYGYSNRNAPRTNRAIQK